ncbi:hypothetical protein ACP70R_002528 [Stipagrostis hirtigluma subsp. patula]
MERLSTPPPSGWPILERCRRRFPESRRHFPEPHHAARSIASPSRPPDLPAAASPMRRRLGRRRAAPRRPTHPALPPQGGGSAASAASPPCRPRKAVPLRLRPPYRATPGRRFHRVHDLPRRTAPGRRCLGVRDLPRRTAQGGGHAAPGSRCLGVRNHHHHAARERRCLDIRDLSLQLDHYICFYIFVAHGDVVVFDSLNAPKDHYKDFVAVLQLAYMYYVKKLGGKNNPARPKSMKFRYDFKSEATTGNRLLWILLLRTSNSDHREEYLARPMGENGMLTVIRDLCRSMHREIWHKLGAFYYPDKPMGQIPKLCWWRRSNLVV